MKRDEEKEERLSRAEDVLLRVCEMKFIFFFFFCTFISMMEFFLNL